MIVMLQIKINELMPHTCIILRTLQNIIHSMIRLYLVAVIPFKFVI